MKNFTFFLLLIIAMIGYAQPTTNAPAPTNSEADVISIYSDAFATNVATDYNPGWGQSGTVNTTFDPTSGGTNYVMAYTNFNYQGTLLTAQNAAGMEFIHVDVWVAPGTSRMLKMSPINNGTGVGEVLVEVPLTPGAWNSVNLAKADFTGMTWDSVFQFKFDGQFNADGSANTTEPFDIYIDNLYFWKSEVASGTDATLSDLKIDGVTLSGFTSSAEDYSFGLVEGTATIPQITAATTTDPSATVTSTTQASAIPGDATVLVTAADGTTTKTYTISFFYDTPMGAAPTPTPASGTVISVYSDEYSDIASTDMNPNWGQSTVFSEVMLGGNATAKYEGLNYQGIQLGSITDVSSMTYLNLDIWTTTSTALNVYLINSAGSGAPGAPVETSSSLTVPTSGWSTFQIPLTDFSGVVNLQFVDQFKFDGNGTFYLDNLYFTTQALSVQNIDLQLLNVYPNPATSNWTIQTKSQNIQSIRLFDMLGKSVLTLTPNTQEVLIDASGLKSGLYFAQVKTLSGVNSLKLIKN